MRMSLARAPQLARIATRSFHASPPARGGGGAHPPYPHHVWSPSGGWWSNPADWKRNSYIAGVVGVFLWGMVFSLSASIEVRAHTHRAPPAPPLFRGVLGPSRTRRGGKERALRTPRERARPRFAPPLPPGHTSPTLLVCVCPPTARSVGRSLQRGPSRRKPGASSRRSTTHHWSEAPRDPPVRALFTPQGCDREDAARARKLLCSRA